MIRAGLGLKSRLVRDAPPDHFSWLLSHSAQPQKLNEFPATSLFLGTNTHCPTIPTYTNVPQGT